VVDGILYLERATFVTGEIALSAVANGCDALQPTGWKHRVTKCLGILGDLGSTPCLAFGELRYDGHRVSNGKIGYYSSTTPHFAGRRSS